MGGALGNLIDRFRLKYVVDYIYFSFWPAFNVADSAVTIGVALLVLAFFRGEKGARQDASDTV
jgi:signal peptidase II